MKYVGKYGGYGSELAENGTVKDQTELDKVLSKYEYGYQVVAGRDNYQSKTNLAMVEQPEAMLDQCTVERSQMDRRI